MPEAALDIAIEPVTLMDTTPPPTASAPAPTAAPTPFAHLGHRRLLKLVNELQRVATTDFPLPQLTAHMAADILDFLGLERCRVVIAAGEQWRIAADLGWSGAAANAYGSVVNGVASEQFLQTALAAQPQLYFRDPPPPRPGEGPLDLDAPDGAEAAPPPRQGYLCVPVMHADRTLAVLELGVFAEAVILDRYTTGFLAAMAEQFAIAVASRIPSLQS